MLGNIYSITSVMLLCSVSFCNALSEERQADVETELSEMKKQLKSIRDDLQLLNEAVFSNRRTPQGTKQTQHVKKREVISADPLTNLPLGDLEGLHGPPGKDGKDSESGGAVYTRWGRTVCGNSSTLLYSGYAGGSSHSKGEGVDHQCMPWDPQYNGYYDGSDIWAGSGIAGVEYMTYSYGIFPDSAHLRKAPCATCYTNNRSAIMTIPAKRDCLDGGNKEYEGYLMSDYYNYNHQTTFECVDASPEYIGEDATSTGAGSFYFVTIYCTRGAHCPPYSSNQVLTCVVCSR